MVQVGSERANKFARPVDVSTKRYHDLARVYRTESCVHVDVGRARRPIFEKPVTLTLIKPWSKKRILPMKHAKLCLGCMIR